MNKQETRQLCRFGLTDDGRIATVTAIHDDYSRELGYELAEIVVTCNPESPVNPMDITRGTTRQFVVSRRNASVAVDLVEALKELKAQGQEWAGDAECIWSPAGTSSLLELQAVVEVISRHLHHPKEES
jgi:hypothetical protein